MQALLGYTDFVSLLIFAQKGLVWPMAKFDIWVFIMVIISIFSVWQCTKVYQHFCLFGRYTNMWRDSVIFWLWVVSWSLSHTHEPFVLFGKMSYVGRLPISKLSYLLFCCWVLSSLYICVLAPWYMACSGFHECLCSCQLFCFEAVSLYVDHAGLELIELHPPLLTPCLAPAVKNLFKFDLVLVNIFLLMLLVWKFKKIHIKDKYQRDLCFLLALCFQHILTLMVLESIWSWFVCLVDQPQFHCTALDASVCPIPL